MNPRPTLARAYFALQALLGIAWWAAVFRHAGLRDATLGEADPARWVVPDVAFFVLPSLVIAGAAPGSRATKLSLVALIAWTTCVIAVFGWRSLDAGRGAWGVIGMTFALAGTVLAGMRLARGPLAAGLCFPLPLRIRPAAEASAMRNGIRTSIQIVCFWGFFLVVAPWFLCALEQRWNLRYPPLSSSVVTIVGWILLATMSLLGLWAAKEMVFQGRGTPLPSDTARLLVTTGPYAFVRNPMAVAGILQGVGVGLIGGSWLVVAYALTGSIVWNTLARPYEEADMADRFGPAFEDYRARVRCWIPSLSISPKLDSN
jgi:protein-S-isoprenylcysteine O-methyltransferase Ste14